MPKREDISKILVIGSGPVVIGQAAEFDYSASQACRSLREEGYEVVLLNSNPATIQTDHEIADRVYIEPITVEAVETIIRKEEIDAIEPHMGGQTALNLVVSLKKMGIIDKYGIKIIGTPVESIEISEDRQKFHDFLISIGERDPERYRISRSNYKEEIEKIPFMPVIVRTSFSLGGSGGNIVKTKEELKAYAEELFRGIDEDYIEVNRSLAGLKELEYEMIRDSIGNCITVCNMENLDPMGVHTGESIVVTPSQTLSDIQYHMLRDAAIKIVSGLGIVGACNIQFALDGNDYYVVEVNPRTSRSSALASKATGYPIARIAAKIAVGYNLTEIRNPITKNTFAAFEPSLDYVTVKIPRWPFDKFSVDRTIGVQMKSIGEVMGIGRTFEEALMKAIASLDIDLSYRLRLYVSDEEIWNLVRTPNDRRIFAIFEALFRDFPVDRIMEESMYDRYFIEKMQNIVDYLKTLEFGHIPENLISLKKLGISDEIIGRTCGIDPDEITRYRITNRILPVFKEIDTCSGEFEVIAPYLYSTYEDEDELPGISGFVAIIGSGPNRIAQGLEFDYGAVKAITALRKMGVGSVMINSNPETVSTDFDVSDALFFEPITVEHVSNILAKANLRGLIVQFSGQTGQNIARRIENVLGSSVVMGTSSESIDRIEDRSLFSKRLEAMGIDQPKFEVATNAEEAINKSLALGLPVILRASHVIGGRAMDIIYDYDFLVERSREVFENVNSVLVSKYLENAVEIDVDFVSNGEDFQICGILVHIEEAGVHSGDATMIFGPKIVPQAAEEKIKSIVGKLVREFNLIGISNLQAAIKDDEVYVIELNARSSRSIPFISKATGYNWVELAVSAIMTGKLEKVSVSSKGYFVKVSVFPFSKFNDMDVSLGPEMKSTGEAMYPGFTMEEAIRKSILRDIKSVFISVRDDDKPRIIEAASIMKQNGLKIYATMGTSRYLRERGIECETVYRIKDERKPRIYDMILAGYIDLVINTPEMNAGSVRDGFKIRRLCVRKGIPLVTNINLANAYSKCLSYTNIDYREISSYH